ncbi:HlyD family efflux transporter periplasmic adaptor subunit [Pseudomonas sp. TTU2014-080ASC]|uniref:HlyD family efflux transporter periplasmic adaptor subunit n=1 Tax=Pseudomonas sp. TTU2014-080ASC TaxID=1729724 RepID=UPI0007187FFC|nr:HlyD family efflux transporter periplasmic adaptor subunit [Pseudomonas sp. TTU2014-080ASC]KRW57858.1 secretion protein HlyD [Pseudomonas sp. TTU2014-080ASC]
MHVLNMSDESLRHELSWSTKLVWLFFLAITCFFLWSYFAVLDEVSTGTGKVIPSSREQFIQSLEGGVLINLRVKEGEIVQKGQVLALLDRTRIESSVEEVASKVRAAQATAARLSAELNGGPLQFPQELYQERDLINAETALYKSRRQGLEQSLAGLEKGMVLIKSELAMTMPLVSRGAASDVEVLRLRRQLNELEIKHADIKAQYIIKAREELAKVREQIESQASITRGRSDSLSRTTLISPVKGIVKDITTTTIGGVIPANGLLMTIVPLGDQLQVEARIYPEDIAYIYPGQEATVKISAFDYSVYGGMPGKVMMISPDTIQDEVHPDVYYYRVYVLTDSDKLTSKSGKEMPVVPGMVATVDIHTGKKSVLSYLLSPLNKAREALRER